jgi:integrase
MKKGLQAEACNPLIPTCSLGWLMGLEPTTSGITNLVSWSPFLREIVTAALEMRRSTAAGYIFANQDGQPYTDSGFKTMWNRVMHDYAAAGGKWFTTHDLRVYYVTEKGEKGENPETHKNPATTKRVYDRTRVVKVKPLG